MNREPDFDTVLMDWIDEGADRAPERFVWAALDEVERTSQRGAWQAPMEDLLMQLKRAGPILSIAAVVALAIFALQFVAPNVGDPDSTPRAHVPEDLQTILVTEANAPEGVTVTRTSSGVLALVEPTRGGGEVIDTSRFVDAFLTELSDSPGGYFTWGALFETEDAAREAFDFIVSEHESPDGWDLGTGTALEPRLGDEGLEWTGEQYRLDPPVRTILWRMDDLVLAAVVWGERDEADLRQMADGMADRAK